MFDIKNTDINPLSKKSMGRYNNLPKHIQIELDKLDNMNFKEYQLKVIQRNKSIPKKGDIFFVNPSESKYFVGVIVNDNVSNINGSGLFVVLILRNKVLSLDSTDFEIDLDNLLINPSIVGKEYWTRGYFYSNGLTIDDISNLDYGFYSIGKGKYYDEYGSELNKIPKHLGIYGVSTISGIAYKINQELIIDSSLWF